MPNSQTQIIETNKNSLQNRTFTSTKWAPPRQTKFSLQLIPTPHSPKKRQKWKLRRKFTSEKHPTEAFRV